MPGEEGPQLIAVIGDGTGWVGPRIDSLGERQVMEPAEQLERAVPALIRNDLGGDRFSSEASADLCVQLRAGPLALLGLVEEAALEPGRQLWSAAFACSAIFPNASGSTTAISARTLRSSSIPAFRHPETNWL
jgi:hypothetical protein